MAAYVDQPELMAGRGRVCRLFADSELEFFEFTHRARIANRGYARGPVPFIFLSRDKRKRAIKYGAIEVDNDKLERVTQAAPPDHADRQQSARQKSVQQDYTYEEIKLL